MKAKTKRYFALLAGVSALTVGLAGCEVQRTTTADGVPTEAKDIRDVGNGWVTFHWRGECFLYNKRVYDRSLSQALTRIACAAG